jgi:hypothetical protein
MAHISHEIVHGLTLEQAKRTAHQALEQYLERYRTRGLSGRWSSSTRAELAYASAGMQVKAVVDVLSDVLRVEAQVPFMLRPFKPQAVAALEDEARKWIERAKTEVSA